MKTLLLTLSGRFILQNNLEAHLPRLLGKSRIAYITTTAQKVNDNHYMHKQKEGMDALKLNYTELDIADKTSDAVELLLQGFDVIFMEGGNSYYLLHVILQTGFEQTIRKLLNQGVVYIGTSAGSYVAGLSIEPATWTERGFDRFGITDYTAMSLVPFAIKAHYTFEKHENLKKHMETIELPLKVLSDDQALLVQGDMITLLGNQETIAIH